MRILCKGGVFCVYGRNLQQNYTSALSSLSSVSGGSTIFHRNFSKGGNEEEISDVSEAQNKPLNGIPPVASQEENTSPWLDIMMGIFSPKLTPLPGCVGVGASQKQVMLTKELYQKLQGRRDAYKMMVTKLNDTNYNKQKEVLEFSNSFQYEDMTFEEVNQPIPEVFNLECRVQACPKLLQKDMSRLLPSWSSSKKPISVITISQRTENDMSGWCAEMEDEREIIMEQFVNTALEVCNKLKESGYQADFIDPSSGRPYLGEYTTDTFFETDERYRHLGFTIEDLGCCKVLTHRIFGSHVFVGALFTTAPINGTALYESLKSLNFKNIVNRNTNNANTSKEKEED